MINHGGCINDGLYPHGTQPSASPVVLQVLGNARASHVSDSAPGGVVAAMTTVVIIMEGGALNR